MSWIILILWIFLTFIAVNLLASDLTVDPNLAIIEKVTDLGNCLVVEGWIPSIKEDASETKIYFKEYWHNDGGMIRKYFNNNEKCIGEFEFRFQSELKNELYYGYGLQEMPMSEYLLRFAPWLLHDYAYGCGGPVLEDYRTRYCPWK